MRIMLKLTLGRPVLWDKPFYRGYTEMTDEKMGELLTLLEKALEGRSK